MSRILLCVASSFAGWQLACQSSGATLAESAHQRDDSQAASEPANSQPTPRSPTASKRYRVAAIGDSLTAYQAGGGGYLRYLAQHCPKSRFDNYGVGGEMVNQMRRRLTRDLARDEGSARYTHVIVFGGVNDLYSDQTAGRSFEKISSDFTQIYETVEQLGAEPIAVTVAPWGGFKRYFNSRRSAATERLNAWIRARHGVNVATVIDAYALLSCGDPERLCDAVAKPFKDGLHFGPEGHRRLGAALLAAAFSDCE